VTETHVAEIYRSLFLYLHLCSFLSQEYTIEEEEEEEKYDSIKRK
jgi:hypothetical protein